MKKVLTLILLLHTNFCFSQNADNWSAFAASTYSIQYPSSWKMDTSIVNGPVLIILSEAEDSNDQFKENVNLIIQDFPVGEMNLDKFVQLSEEQFRQLGEQASLLESSRKNTSDNLEYQQALFTMVFGKNNFKCLQHSYVTDSKVYILTFTAEVNKFDVFKDIGEKILSSLVIIK